MIRYTEVDDLAAVVRELTGGEGVAEVYAAVASRALRIRIGARYSLERAREAHEELQGRRTTGKLLLLPRCPPPQGTVTG